MAEFPHSADLRKGRSSEPGEAYLVTKCRVEGLKLALTEPPAPEAIIKSIRWHQEQRLAHLLAFVVMPDHVHWVFVLGEKRSLDQVVKGFASVTSREILRCRRLDPPVLWQDEYHDHRLRSVERTWASMDYVHANPVRRGLCAKAEDWPWSTADPRYHEWVEGEYLG